MAVPPTDFPPLAKFSPHPRHSKVIDLWTSYHMNQIFQHLLVLDDVWNQDYAKWDLLCAPFHYGVSGSTIIVTTRSQDVAKTMGSKEVHELKDLCDEDCLYLLAQHAFARPNFDGYQEYKEVGEVIGKRCKGLPLAAKSLGGLLHTKGNPKLWAKVSTSKIWELQSNGFIPALRLSYHHLPSYLKPLFAYCSIFPKAHEFDKQELIMLWGIDPRNKSAPTLITPYISNCSNLKKMLCANELQSLASLQELAFITLF